MMMLFATLTLAAAIGPVAWLGCARLAGLREWLVASAAAATMSCAAVVIGPWALLSVYLRPVVLVALMAAIVVAASRVARAAPLPDPRDDRRRLIRHSFIACVCGLTLIEGVAGWLTPSRTTDLHFPLHDGTYAVLQGGNSLLTNPFHHWFPSDRHGLDLVKLNALGNRAQRVAPGHLTDYASYDVAVHSPCTGVVEESVNDVADNPPGTTDPQHLSGNYVLLRCGALRVLLAHLRRGSVALTARSPVRRAQLVGRIGNSGNTNEPHLHVSAVAANVAGPWRYAAGVPITFDGRFLTMNDVVR